MFDAQFKSFDKLMENFAQRSSRGLSESIMKISPLAGKPAQASMLVNVPRLVTAYYTEVPDPSVPDAKSCLRHLRTSWFLIRQGIQ